VPSELRPAGIIVFDERFFCFSGSGASLARHFRRNRLGGAMAARSAAVLERDTMSRSQRIRYAAALFLVLVVAMPPTLAAAPLSAKGGGISRLCRLLIGILGKEGSSLDPDGKLVASLRSCAKADEGSSVDPDGLRRATADSGSSVDPDGLCRATADSGSSVDPSGRP
jgi:hypothetical protein